MLVTGGSSGIGLEIARQFGTKREREKSNKNNKDKCHAIEILNLNKKPFLLSSGLHGASVFVTGRRQAVLDAAVADLRSCGVAHAQGIQGDVRKPEDVERWVSVATTTTAGPSASADGALDVLVNCAAGNFLAAADALSANGFRTVLDIDAVGTFSTSRAAFPALKRAAERSSNPSSSSPPSSPVVINISATLHYGATWWQAHACAAKAAVDALTRSLALEWGEFGVRVCGVAPGPIAGTAGLSKLSGSSGGGKDNNDLAAAIASLVPLGRLGSAWDIAINCVWLSSAGARFTSGDTLVVDGAAWLWRPPAVPRAVVAEVSRKVEAGSRAMTKATNAAAGAGGASRL